MNRIMLSGVQRAQFDRDGFLAMRGLFSADEVDDIRSTFMAAAKERGHKPQVINTTNTSRVQATNVRSRAMRPHCASSGPATASRRTSAISACAARATTAPRPPSASPTTPRPTPSGTTSGASASRRRHRGCSAGSDRRPTARTGDGARSARPSRGGGYRTTNKQKAQRPTPCPFSRRGVRL